MPILQFDGIAKSCDKAMPVLSALFRTSPECWCRHRFGSLHNSTEAERYDLHDGNALVGKKVGAVPNLVNRFHDAVATAS